MAAADGLPDKMPLDEGIKSALPAAAIRRRRRPKSTNSLDIAPGQALASRFVQVLEPASPRSERPVRTGSSSSRMCVQTDMVIMQIMRAPTPDDRIATWFHAG